LERVHFDMESATNDEKEVLEVHLYIYFYLSFITCHHGMFKYVFKSSNFLFFKYFFIFIRYIKINMDSNKLLN
jgi:hypothetical protein